MIDVSSNNHPGNKPIDWKSVRKAGYQGVMIKCTEGVSYTNPWLKPDAIEANRAQLHTGFYHFARPSVGNALAQAEFALTSIANLPRDLGLALDLEVNAGISWPDLSTWAENFLARISQANIGSPIYLNNYFLSQLPAAPFGHKLWLASPSSIPRRHCWMWQQAAKPVKGIEGLVDINAFNG